MKKKCDDEWISYGEKCYKIFLVVSNQTFAEYECEKYKSNLVYIEDDAEFEFLKEIYKKNFYGFQLWASDFRHLS